VVKDGSIMRKCLGAALVAFGALVTISCGGPTDPSQNQTETLTNRVVQPQSADVRAFTVGNTGEFSVKLTALTPGNVFVGVIWGQSPDGVTCGPLQSNLTVSSSNVGRTILSGSILIKGQYCVAVFDPASSLGTNPWPVAQTYSMEVSHP
jgi:hypothetical protein